LGTPAAGFGADNALAPPTDIAAKFVSKVAEGNGVETGTGFDAPGVAEGSIPLLFSVYKTGELIGGQSG